MIRKENNEVMHHKEARIEWIDIAKGIGIILVMLGHCVNIEGWCHRYIYTFHMPLFFLLSGLVLKVEFSRIFIYKKIRSLILPYFTFVMLGFIITLLIPSWRSRLSLKGIVADVYLANPEFINVSSIWFLACLFIVICILTLINRIGMVWLQKIVIVFLAFVGFLFGKLYNDGVDLLIPCNRLPWNIDVALVAIVFTAIGYYYKDIIIVHITKLAERRMITLFIILLMALIVAVVAFFNGRVNLHGLLYNNLILYLIGSICGTELILAFSIFMQNYRVKRPIIWLGKNSLVLICIQAVLVRIFLMIYNNITDNEVRLYYLLGISEVVCFIFVLGISVLFVIGLSKIRRKKI